MEKEAQEHLKRRDYRRYLECTRKMYKRSETPENRDLYNNAQKMHDSYLGFLEFKRKNPHDLYGLLGVDRTASSEEIRQAYRRLVLKLHPDRSLIPETGEAMQVVLDAYNTLIDPDRRAEYDTFGCNRATGPGQRVCDSTFAWTSSRFGEEADLYNFIYNLDEIMHIRNIYGHRFHRREVDIGHLDPVRIFAIFVFLVLFLVTFG